MTEIIFSELNKGHWQIVILLLFFAGIFFELRRFVKNNDVRHKEHTHLDTILTNNLVELKAITKVHEAEIEGLKDDVKDVRDEIRKK